MTSMSGSNAREHLVGGNARSGHVPPDRFREEAVEACSLGRVELVDIVRGDEVDLSAFEERARLIEDKATCRDAGADHVHAGELTRFGDSRDCALVRFRWTVLRRVREAM